MRAPLLVLLSCLLTVTALAADPTGTWTGKVVMDTSKLPAEAKAQATKALAKVKITMVLKKDKTFTSSVTGSPDGVNHATTGTWSQTGDKVSLRAKTRDGKSAPSDQPQAFVISKDGKSMIASTNAASKPGGKPVSNGPSVKIVMSRSK